MLRSAARSEGLSPTQAQLLLRITEAGPGDAEPSRLALRLDVSGPTVTDSLATLQRKGLVSVERDTADRRRRVFTATPPGRAAASRLSRWNEPLVAAAHEVDAEARPSVLRAALDMIATLVDSGAISVARTCTTCRFFRPDVHPDGMPHHCGLLNMPLSDGSLRVDCPEHQAAS